MDANRLLQLLSALLAVLAFISTVEAQCGEGRQFCRSVKKCVATSQLCDGKDDCGDNSDEENCQVTTAGPPAWLNTCGEGRQFCDGVKKCVSRSQLCDGKDDCGDNSDEKNCKDAPALRSSEPKAANCTTGEGCRNSMACKTGGTVYCCPGGGKLAADGNTRECTCDTSTGGAGFSCSGGGSIGTGSQFLPSQQGSDDKMCKKDRDCDNEPLAICRGGDVKVCCPGGSVTANFSPGGILRSCSCSATGSGRSCSTTSGASHIYATSAVAILFLAVSLVIKLN